MINTNWFEAVAYCNWLSEQEGLPPSEWCYEPLGIPPAMLAGSSVGLLAGSQGPLAATGGLVLWRMDRPHLGGMNLARNYLRRSGYRLPTEAEMEYAIRAGAVTARYYGETEELLPKYAWCIENSQERTWPVGSLKPNDLGFFDVQGNVFTWCQESYKPYPQSKESSKDTEDDLVIVSTRDRVLRGGSFFNVATRVRSACRSYNVPTLRQVYIGFRPGRTLPVGPTGSPQPR
jgi:formylglycine-generating enzyme required for sulfatase activity